MLNELQLGSSLIIISYFAISIVVVDAIFKKNKNVGFFYALFGLILSLIAAGYNLYTATGLIVPTNPEDLLSSGMITFGGYSSFFDILFLVAGILTMIASRKYLKLHYFEYIEFYSLIIFSITGMMLIGHANNLLVLFIGIELMSIPFYILSGYFRNQIRSVESALKYFLLGSFATGFLLYGIALIYGSTGSLDLSVISSVIAGVQNNGLLLIGVGLVVIGLSFKIAIFPFHQWAPDVYQGAPTVVTAFMSTAGKAAALLALIIITKPLLPVFNVFGEDGVIDYNTIQVVIAIMSGLTMLVGNISALVQKNVKRMLAYSSVAHAGYLLMGIVANNQLGWAGIAFYSTAYLFMQIGSFIIVSVLEKENNENLNISDYAGLSKSNPMLAALMALFMFSLAGIPPMAGFFGKYYLFTATIKAGYTWLTIVAVISSIISMYFYIGLVIQMYFKDRTDTIEKVKAGAANISIIISAIAILVIGFYPPIITEIADKCFALFVM
jgi:NADH-quinone oxidoreductase subunit N